MMNVMTAAAICLELTKVEQKGKLTAEQKQKLDEARAFVQGWAKTAASNVVVKDPFRIMK